MPVNCKLCGVTIRQSRNLRRHIDQKHSKPKNQLKQKKLKEKVVLKQKINPSSKITSIKGNELNNSIPAVLLNFSDDSFTQLTEEILNYSITRELTSNENSFSSLSAAPLTENCLVEETIPVSTHNLSISPSTFSDSSSSSVLTVQSRSLSTLLEKDLCFPLSTSDTLIMTTEPTKSMSNDSCASIGTFECSNLEDSCNANDTALKELENQLFSVCFCSVDTDV